MKPYYKGVTKMETDQEVIAAEVYRILDEQRSIDVKDIVIGVAIVGTVWYLGKRMINRMVRRQVQEQPRK
jgi:hypothetical protein